MQDEISGQLFTERRVQVYLDEHFDLSAQYTPRQLMETYFDSLVCEVSSFSPVMGKFLRDSEVSYPEDQEIRITMEDSCLSQQMYEKLEEALPICGFNFVTGECAPIEEEEDEEDYWDEEEDSE